MNDMIGIVDLGSYLPGEPILPAAGEGPMARSPLFRPPDGHHHVAKGERAAAMAQRAAAPLFERQALRPADVVDVIITNTLLPDVPITGCGAELASLLGCRPEWIIDLHNSGCGSFPHMLGLAQAILGSGSATGALICNVQNIAGTMFSQPHAQGETAAISAGDGAGVALVMKGRGSPVLQTELFNDPDAATDMYVDLADGRRYWEPGSSELAVSFSEENGEVIIERGNRIVPHVVEGLCTKLGIRSEEIDLLITNQPNRMFLRNWRQTLGIPPERHRDTFDRYGNLYGAGIPITLHDAARAKEIRDGDLVVAAGFAHAGDFAAAVGIRWQAPPDPS